MIVAAAKAHIDQNNGFSSTFVSSLPVAHHVGWEAEIGTQAMVLFKLYSG
jgi:hypothetical protein